MASATCCTHAGYNEWHSVRIPVFQSKFLDKWGEGVHHIGFYVDDVDAEVDQLVKAGANLLIHDPGRFAYVDAGGPGGAIFELMCMRA